MYMNTLLFDVRNNDEIDSIKYNIKDSNMDILYMPANIVKNNLPFLNEYFQKYDKVNIICKSGARSKTIKEKYFMNNDNVFINEKHFNDLDENHIIHSDGIHISITRKIQIISGSIILFLFFISQYYDNVKYMFVLFAFVMIYVGVSGNCFMSSILTKGDI
jgi:hypothetical protein